MKVDGLECKPKWWLGASSGWRGCAPEGVPLRSADPIFACNPRFRRECEPTRFYRRTLQRLRVDKESVIANQFVAALDLTTEQAG